MDDQDTGGEFYFHLLTAGQKINQIKDAEKVLAKHLIQIRRWIKIAPPEKVEAYRRSFPEVFKRLDEQV
jgi:hypothetical protein